MGYIHSKYEGQRLFGLKHGWGIILFFFEETIYYFY